MSPAVGRPHVSVVIAAYQHAPFIAECIASVQRQTFSDWEVVVTDDGSTDGTADVLRDLARTEPRLRLHCFAANRGACAAINDAITRARGEFIAVLNSDDRFLPDKLARQVAFLEAHPEVGAVFGLPLFIDERGAPFVDDAHKDYHVFNVPNRPRAEWLWHFFRYGNCLCHPSVLIRRACYDQAGLYDPRLAQLPDLDLWVRLCARQEIHVLHEPLLEFRIRDGERNASAARPDVLAREHWERLHILRHYPHLDAPLIAALLAPAPVEVIADPLLRLAHAARDAGSPAHRMLALDIFHERLAPSATPAPEPLAGSVPGLPEYPEYLRLTADLDVFRQGLTDGWLQLMAEKASMLGEIDRQAAELAACEETLTRWQGSWSWRLTSPLRMLRRRWRAS